MDATTVAKIGTTSTLAKDIKSGQYLDPNAYNHKQLDTAIQDLKNIKDNIQKVRIVNVMLRLLAK